MPTMPYPVRNVESLLPSVDARNSTSVFALDGQNFLFDSKGPKSGFASRYLTPFPLYSPRDVQGLVVQGRSFVFTQDSVLEWRTQVPFTWNPLIQFVNQIPKQYRNPWQGIYLSGFIYLSHPYRGMYRSALETQDADLAFNLITDATVPGLIRDVRGMEVIRGRAILVNDDTIQWGAVEDFSDFTPALGGAGFQLIRTFVKGTFLALTGFQDGFIVWTTQGAVMAEYIGGDEVWHFSPYISKERPVGDWATITLSNGSSAYLSRHGLMLCEDAKNSKPWTPEFNEFFREYMKDLSVTKSMWRLEYDENRELIYLCESTDGETYWRTLVLTPTLNKWGVFSESHYGMLPLTAEQFGYVDRLGIPQVFVKGFSRSIEPGNELGLDRHYPRFEKTLGVPSSSAVSRAYAPILNGYQEPFVLPQADWYLPGSMSPYPQIQGGMNSWLEVGYFLVDGLQSADGMIEIQELLIGGEREAAPEPMDFTTEWKEDEFYGVHEDWNSDASVVRADVFEDLQDGSGIEDLNSGMIQLSEDFQNMEALQITFADSEDIDWMTESGDEDWGGPVSGLPTLGYGLSIQSSEDGITFDSYTPVLARFNTASKLFTVLTNSVYHRLRFEALEPGHYYHVQSLSLTMNYGGQVV